MTQFRVVGAGMAGLFAAAVFRDQCMNVLESQPSLPNNHSALLRFRSSVVGDALNIPFRKVRVMKAVDTTGNPIRDAILYSRKTNGVATLRSIIDARGNIEDRFIAPPDLIERMAAKVTADIRYSRPWEPIHGLDREDMVPTISTLPMPMLMDMLDYDGEAPIFASVSGYTIVAQLKDVDLCATMYFPSDNVEAYRASITGSTLIIEYSDAASVRTNVDRVVRSQLAMNTSLSACTREPMAEVQQILRHFGLTFGHTLGDPEINHSTYAKILPISDDARKRFIVWASDVHNVYSFGRFATWRPGLLMDDLLGDLRVIQKLAGGESNYDHRRK